MASDATGQLTAESRRREVSGRRPMRRAVSGGMLKLRAMRLREVRRGSAGRAVTTACSAPGESAVYVSRSSCGLQGSDRRAHQDLLLLCRIHPPMCQGPQLHSWHPEMAPSLGVRTCTT